jgi:protein phosphatase
MLRRVATDTCWSDPADDESRMDPFGFGHNPRGQGVILFGSRAVDHFLDRYGFEFIFRAHQEKSDGLKLSKNARVFTIFSTSAYVGHQNGAGVVLVADGKIRLIIKNADHEDES